MIHGARARRGRQPAALAAALLLAACQPSSPQAHSPSTMERDGPVASGQAPIEVDLAPGGLRASLHACIQSAAGVTPALQDCLDEEQAFQTARLDEAMQAWIARQPPEERAGVQEEAHRWAAARDVQCDPGRSPGQGQMLDAANCVLNATANRATALERR